jgi:hypothetical protein
MVVPVLKPHGGGLGPQPPLMKRCGPGAKGWALDAAVVEHAQNWHVPLVSCRFAGKTSIAPVIVVFVHPNMDLSAADLLSFFPLSILRSKQLSACRQDRLSMTMALGSGELAPSVSQLIKQLSRVQWVNSP